MEFGANGTLTAFVADAGFLDEKTARASNARRPQAWYAVFGGPVGPAHFGSFGFARLPDCCALDSLSRRLNWAPCGILLIGLSPQALGMYNQLMLALDHLHQTGTKFLLEMLFLPRCHPLL